MTRFEDVFSSMVYPKAKIPNVFHDPQSMRISGVYRTIGSLKLLYIEFVETMSLSLVSRSQRLNNPFFTSLDQAK